MTQDKEENHLIEERRKKLASLKSANMAFPNDFKKKHSAQELKEEFDVFSKGELEKKKAKCEENQLMRNGICKMMRKQRRYK